MMLLLLLPWGRIASAATKPLYDPCRCNDYEKFDNGTLWDRANCCVPWVPRPVGPELVKVDGIVYRLVHPTTTTNHTKNVSYNNHAYDDDYYEKYSLAFVAPQIPFPGEASVLFNADNRYTNFSCAGFSCRSVVVYRETSGCNGTLYANSCVDYDAPRDWHAPLCHNNTAARKCVIWVPIRELTAGTDWTIGVSVAGVVAIVLVARSACADGCVDMFLALTWWLYTLILSELSVPVLSRFTEWRHLTEVDLDYITYQTCIQECSQLADTSVAIAEINQCNDRGVACSGALSAGGAIACRGCQAHRADWLGLVRFAHFLWALLLYHWVVLFLYALAIQRKATWSYTLTWALLLPPLALLIACAILTSEMALYGVHGLSTYFMPSLSIYDIGLDWTICMCIWWPVCTLAKCLALGQRKKVGDKEPPLQQQHEASLVVYAS